MAVEVVDEIPADAPASALRERLAAESAKRVEAESKLSLYETRDLLVEKKFDLVKAEDLTGVAAAQREAKAAEIQASRQQLQEELVRKALQDRGFDGEALEDLMSQAVGQQAAEVADAAAASRIRQAGQLPGTPVPPVNAEKLHGQEAIEAYFDQKSKKAKR